MSTGDGPLCRPVQALLTSGEVGRINPDDDVDVGVLLVRYPPILQYPPSVRTILRARHLLIVANQAPLEPDGTDRGMSSPTCTSVRTSCSGGSRSGCRRARPSATSWWSRSPTCR
ncbi:MAG: hypothetical protein H0U62_07885 [Actinobacteria bacterium]|nr:hypothetical protein [Actinomycetota bacterium]